MIRLLVKSLARYLTEYDIEHADERTCYEYYKQALNGFLAQDTPAESRYGREPDKVKSLAQYLDEYIEHEIELDNISPEVSELFAYNSWRELFEQALDAYQSTENVTIKIERK